MEIIKTLLRGRRRTRMCCPRPTHIKHRKFAFSSSNLVMLALILELIDLLYNFKGRTLSVFRWSVLFGYFKL
jgi:hypothetical protein